MTSQDGTEKKTWTLISQRYQRRNDNLMRELSKCQNRLAQQKIVSENAIRSVAQCEAKWLKSLDDHRVLLGSGQPLSLYDLDCSREAIAERESAVTESKYAAETAEKEVEGAKAAIADVNQQLNALQTRQSVCDEQIIKVTQKIALADDEQADEEAEATHTARLFSSSRRR